MICKYLFILLATAAICSCSSKEAASKRDTYIVSARKMISLTSNNWSNAEPLLKDKLGYQYKKAPENLSNILKAVITLPAMDDSNRTVKGTLLLNVAPNNKIFFGEFKTDTLTKTAAYAMMLNYNNESVQTLTEDSTSIGEIEENRYDRNTTIAEVLSKINSGQEAKKLAIIYDSKQGSFVMLISKLNDGRYIFGYRSSR